MHRNAVWAHAALHNVGRLPWIDNPLPSHGSVPLGAPLLPCVIDGFALSGDSLHRTHLPQGLRPPPLPLAGEGGEGFSPIITTFIKILLGAANPHPALLSASRRARKRERVPALTPSASDMWRINAA